MNINEEKVPCKTCKIGIYDPSINGTFDKKERAQLWECDLCGAEAELWEIEHYVQWKESARKKRKRMGFLRSRRMLAKKAQEKRKNEKRDSIQEKPGRRGRV